MAHPDASSDPAGNPFSPRLMDRAAFEAAAGTPEDRADRILRAALATLESRAAAMEAAAGLRMEALAVQAESLLLGVQEKLDRLLNSAAQQAQELHRIPPVQMVETKPERAAARRRSSGSKARLSKAARRPAPER